MESKLYIVDYVEDGPPGSIDNRQSALTRSVRRREMLDLYCLLSRKLLCSNDIGVGELSSIPRRIGDMGDADPAGG